MRSMNSGLCFKKNTYNGLLSDDRVCRLQNSKQRQDYGTHNDGHIGVFYAKIAGVPGTRRVNALSQVLAKSNYPEPDAV